jgi:hypothetical protein
MKDRRMGGREGIENGRGRRKGGRYNEKKKSRTVKKANKKWLEGGKGSSYISSQWKITYST